MGHYAEGYYMKKKVKYNLLFAIQDMNLDLAFDEYKKTLNPDISENRKARAFLTKYARVIGPYKLPCYVVGQERSHNEPDPDLINLIKETSLYV